MPAPVRCPGCGLLTDGDASTPVPTAYRASPVCWQRYGELLARSYGDHDRRDVHQLVVDAYVAQHPSDAEPRHVRQLALCLMTLQLFVEAGHDVRLGPVLHQRMAANLPAVHALEPPETSTGTTVVDVLAAQDAAAHRRLVRTWADEVWAAWQMHHVTVRRWNADALR